LIVVEHSFEELKVLFAVILHADLSEELVEERLFNDLQ